MNVKEGDIAIFLPSIRPAGMAKAMCLVVRMYGQQTEALKTMFDAYGQDTVWEVQMLESRSVPDGKNWKFFGKTFIKAGEKLHTLDKYLRRIDPPADVADIFSTEPLRDEIITIKGD